MTNTDMQYHLRRQEEGLNRIQNQMGTQERIQNLRDDPIAAAHAVRYKSYLHRLDQFQKNSESTIAEFRVAEGYIQSVNDIVHRLTELSIQGANGTYSKQELSYMGTEANELLKELVTLANSYSGDGNPLFAGDRTGTLAFRTSEGRVPGADGSMVTAVDYVGTIGKVNAEVQDGVYMERNFTGNSVFWADQQQVVSTVDAQNFQVLEDSVIQIDGVDIPLRAGDSVHAVISKINGSDLAVRASLDPLTNGVALQTTVPHQIWLNEPVSTNVLQNLGLTQGGTALPPGNINRDARVLGGSLFDMAINLRDAMFSGDQEALGGRTLVGLRNAQDNILTSLAELGSRDNRLQMTMKTLAATETQYTERMSQVLDLDLTQGILDLKLMENVHKASLGAAGRILPPTLMDFLR